MKKGKFKLMFADDEEKIINQEFNDFKQVSNIFNQLKRKFK